MNQTIHNIMIERVKEAQREKAIKEINRKNFYNKTSTERSDVARELILIDNLQKAEIRKQRKKYFAK